MPKYRLTYFNGKGLAEGIRLALSAAGQSFEDRRVVGEEWQKLKPDIPQQQLPVLEVDGKMICQSGAIIRFVAREHDLYGANNMESTEVDTILETLGDVFKEMLKVFTEKDEGKKEELKKAFGDTIVPKFVAIFCQMLCNNNEGDAYFVGSKLTIADILVYQRFALLSEFFGPDAVKSYTDNAKLHAHSVRLADYPGIKKWNEEQNTKL